MPKSRKRKKVKRMARAAQRNKEVTGQNYFRFKGTELGVYNNVKGFIRLATPEEKRILLMKSRPDSENPA